MDLDHLNQEFYFQAIDVVCTSLFIWIQSLSLILYYTSCWSYLLHWDLCCNSPPDQIGFSRIHPLHGQFNLRIGKVAQQYLAFRTNIPERSDLICCLMLLYTNSIQPCCLAANHCFGMLRDCISCFCLPLLLELPQNHDFELSLQCAQIA